MTDFRHTTIDKLDWIEKQKNRLLRQSYQARFRRDIAEETFCIVRSGFYKMALDRIKAGSDLDEEFHLLAKANLQGSDDVKRIRSETGIDA
jgi:hypothetical protein